MLFLRGRTCRSCINVSFSSIFIMGREGRPIGAKFWYSGTSSLGRYYDHFGLSPIGFTSPSDNKDIHYTGFFFLGQTFRFVGLHASSLLSSSVLLADSTHPFSASTPMMNICIVQPNLTCAYIVNCMPLPFPISFVFFCIFYLFCMSMRVSEYFANICFH